MSLSLFKKIKKIYLSAIFFFIFTITFPFYTLAAGKDPETLFDFFNLSTANVSTQLVSLAILFSLTFFLYGVFTYINAGSSEDKRKQGITLITHGLIALFVVVSLWAIVSLMINTFVGDPLKFQPKIPG